MKIVSKRYEKYQITQRNFELYSQVEKPKEKMMALYQLNIRAHKEFKLILDLLDYYQKKYLDYYQSIEKGIIKKYKDQHKALSFIDQKEFEEKFDLAPLNINNENYTPYGPIVDTVHGKVILLGWGSEKSDADTSNCLWVAYPQDIDAGVIYATCWSEITNREQLREITRPLMKSVVFKPTVEEIIKKVNYDIQFKDVFPLESCLYQARHYLDSNIEPAEKMAKMFYVRAYQLLQNEIDQNPYLFLTYQNGLIKRLADIAAEFYQDFPEKCLLKNLIERPLVLEKQFLSSNNKQEKMEISSILQKYCKATTIPMHNHALRTMISIYFNQSTSADFKTQIKLEEVLFCSPFLPLTEWAKKRMELHHFQKRWIILSDKNRDLDLAEAILQATFSLFLLDSDSHENIKNYIQQFQHTEEMIALTKKYALKKKIEALLIQVKVLNWIIHNESVLLSKLVQTINRQPIEIQQAIKNILEFVEKKLVETMQQCAVSPTMQGIIHYTLHPSDFVQQELISLPATESLAEATPHCLTINPIECAIGLKGDSTYQVLLAAYEENSIRYHESQTRCLEKIKRWENKLTTIENSQVASKSEAIYQ